MTKFTFKDLQKSKCAPLNEHIIASIPEQIKKKDKYNTQRVEVIGIDDKIYKLSKKEAKRYYQLKQLLDIGVISKLRQQVKYALLSHEKITRKNGGLSYIADFVYIRDGVEIVEDCKGFRTKEYKRKKLLMKEIHSIIILET